MPSLTFEIFGIDVSGSSSLQAVTEEARAFRRELQQLDRELESLSGTHTADVQVRVSPPGAAEKLRRDLDSISRGADANVRVAVTPANAITNLRQDLERVARAVVANVRVAVSPANAIANLRRDLERVARAVTANVRVAVSPANAIANLRRDLERLDRFGTVDAGIRLSIDPPDAPAAIRNLSNALNRLRRGGNFIEMRIVVTIDSIERVRRLREELDRIERDIRVRVRVSGEGGGGGGGGGGLATLIGGIKLLPSLADGAAPALATLAANVAAVGSAAITAAPAVIAAGQWIGALGRATVQAAPALAAFAVAGGLVVGTLKLIFAEGSAMRTVLQPIADGITKIGESASRTAAQGLEPLVRAFNKAVLPEVNHFMQQIATTVNSIVGGFLRWAASAEGLTTVKNILHPIWQALDDLDEPILQVGISFAQMLGRIMGVSMEAGSNGLTGILYKLAAAMDRVNADTVSAGFEKLKSMTGQVRNAISTTVSVVSSAARGYMQFRAELGLLGDALSVVAILFGGPIAAAVGAITLLIRHFGQLKSAYQAVVSFFQSSPWGASFMSNMRDAANTVMPALERAFDRVGKIVGPALEKAGIAIKTQLIPTIGRLVSEAAPKVAAFIDSLVGLFETVAPKVGAAFRTIREKVVPIIMEIADTLIHDLAPAVTGFVSAMAPVVAWFVGTAGPMIASVFQNILRIIRGAIDIIVGVFKVFTGLLTGDWQQVWNGLVSILQGAWSILVGLVMLLWTNIATAFQAGWDVVKAIFLAGITAILDLFSTVGDAVIAALSVAGAALVAAGKQLIDWIWQGIQIGVSAILTFFGTIGNAVVTALAAAGGALLAAGTQLIDWIWQGLQIGWNAVSTWFITTTTVTIPGYFLGAITWLLQAGLDLLQGLWNGLTQGWTIVSTWFITTTTVTIPGYFLGAITWLLQAGLDLIQGLWDGAQQTWALVATWFITTTTVTIPGYFLGALEWLLQAGKDIIQGLWDGMKEIWESLSNWVTESISSLISKFKSLFGVGSPSTIFATIGRDVIQGLLNGMKEIWATVEGWFSTLKGIVTGFFDGAATWLFDKGAAIVQGLINGMQSLLGKLRGIMAEIGGIIGGFVGLSPAKWGPLSGGGAPERRGAHIAEDIARGLLTQVPAVRAAADTLAGLLAAATPAAFSGPGFTGTFGGAGLVGQAGGGGFTVVLNMPIYVTGSVVTEQELANAIAPRVRNAVVVGASSNGRRTGLPR